MTPFQTPDDVHLDAAETWLKSGNVVEANAELNRVSPALRRHPDFLAVRYQVLARAECWNECVAVAAAIAQVAPNCPLGWLQRAFALHKLQQTRLALESLLPALELFPDEIELRRRLALYESILGNPNRARERLAESAQLAAEQKCLLEWQAAVSNEPAFRSLLPPPSAAD